MRIALSMLIDNKARLIATIFAVMALCFLSLAQVGLLVGWCNTNSAIILHAKADIWVMAVKTPSFDYGTAIPRTRIYQVRNVPGVDWAEGMFQAWNVWQRPDGRRINVELIGLDQSCVGAPWEMLSGQVEDVHIQKSVIVDELYLPQLGVSQLGVNCEMMGTRATVRGISRGIRTFTASPFVFTSIDSARRFDKRYRENEITYVLVRCGEDETPAIVRDRIRANVPHVDVLTSSEFASRSVTYWMLETGVGITVVLTAVLGIIVSGVITYQSLYAVTQENLSHYATLFALGFKRRELTGMVITQALVLGVVGLVLGSTFFQLAAESCSRTPIPLEMTTASYLMIVACQLGASVLASLISTRAIFSIDPVSVFRA